MQRISIPRPRHGRRRISVPAIADLLACGAFGILILALLGTQGLRFRAAERELAIAPASIPPSVQLTGIDGVEQGGGGAFRWTRPTSALQADLPIIGDYEVTLEVQDAPQNSAPRRLTVLLDGTEAGTVTLTDEPQRFAFRHTGLRGAWDEALPPLRIALQTTPYRVAGDPRELGVILRGATIKAIPPTPAWWLGRALVAALAMGGGYALLRACRVRPLPAGLIVGLGSASLWCLLSVQGPLLPLRLLDWPAARPLALGAIASILGGATGLALVRPVARWLLATALASPALIQVGVILWMIWAEPVQMPWWDELYDSRHIWHVLDGVLTWSDLWQLHLVHRLVTMRAIHLLEISATAWDRRVLLTTQVVVTLLTFGCLAAVLRRTLPDARLRTIILAASGALLFALAQYGHWLLAYGLQFQLAILGMAAGIWLLSDRRIGWGHLALAAVSALLASWSGLQGLLVWGALLPLLWRADWRKWLAWIACAGVVIGTYAVGFPRQSVQRLDLAGLARFTLEDLGAPLGTLQPLTRRTQFWNQQQVTIDPRWAFMIGLFSVVLLALNLGSTRAWRERAFLARIMPWCCLALFSAACAVFTGLGRGTEANAALTSRYQNFAVLWWIALVAIGTLTAWRVWVARQRWHTWPRLLIGVNLLTLVLGTGAYFEVNLTSAAAALDWHQTLRDTESCVRDFTAASDSCMLLLHLSPAAARLRLAQMAEHHLALYRDGPIPSVPGPLGKPGSVPDRTSLREVAYQTLYQIDGLPGALALFDGIQGTLNTRADQPLVLTGWALDVAALPIGPADGVYLTLDDQAARWVPLDRERPDVARRFAAAYLRSGFRAEWPTGTLAPGRHTVKIEVVAANRRGIYPPSPPLEFTVR